MSAALMHHHPSRDTLPDGSEPRREEVSPTVLVVFGATGDLMARKIVPSILHLLRQDALPSAFRVVGVSRRAWSDTDFRDHVRGVLAERGEAGEWVDGFVSMFSYVQGTFEDDATYAGLETRCASITAEWGTCANRLFYLAVPPEHYDPIVRRLAKSGLTQACDPVAGFSRVLIEKPFGRDEASSKRLDELLAEVLREEQIYRIDHYLAKEMLQGILAFRFHNDLFERQWDRSAIERIDISLLETLGVEKRGRFYDGVGALRDVGQNHLLQMLALVTMEQPSSLSADDIRAARAELLESLTPLTAEEVACNSYRAQYEDYGEIEGVEPGSTTETYFMLRARMTGPRWGGVPVTLESGKRVGAVPTKRITVTFRHAHPCLCGEPDGHLRNRVVFDLEPGDAIRVTVWAKAPGLERRIEERTFELPLDERGERVQYVEEYAKLLYDAIKGDQTAFVASGEIAAMWRFTDPVTEAWEAGAVPLESYAPDDASVSERAAASLCGEGPRMQAGVAGLGRMGAGVALNLADHGWDVVGFNRTPAVAHALAEEGLRPADTLGDLVSALRPPRTVFVMVPAGAAVDAVLFGAEGAPGLADLLQAGDTVIDGGNSRYTEAPERARRLAERGIAFLDCGTSGGPAGARTGACLMVGGDRAAFDRAEPLFRDLAVAGGYRFFEGAGSGHFVKMVHNGIEYGMMQAIAEGFALMRESGRGLDLAEVADLYQHRSVIESRLVGWLRSAYERFGDDLDAVSGSPGHTGEGAWTVEAGREAGVAMPVIEASLDFRIDAAERPSYTGQVVQALRNEFGGHGLDASGPSRG